MKLVEQGKPLRALAKGPVRRASSIGTIKLLEEDLHPCLAGTYEERANLLCMLLRVRVNKKLSICRMVRGLDYTSKEALTTLAKDL